MATTNLNIRIDADLKKQAEQIFNELGINMSTALTVFCAKPFVQTVFLLIGVLKFLTRKLASPLTM